MRKMWQCATALGLAAAMVMPAAAYAGETETETAESADDDAAYAPMDETVTIHVGRSEDANAQYLDGQDSLHNYLTDYIREKANVDFVYDFSVSSDYETKVSMAIASGDIPDVMFVTASQIRELAEADAVEDMTDVYNTYASSNLKAAYDTTDGISFQNATYDGKLLGMPSISPGADGIPLLFVRADWMEQCGLDAPKTLEDIVNIVKTFQEKIDPSTTLAVDQNIVSKNGNNSYGLDALFALYGAYPKHWVTDSDGNLVYGSNTEEAKQALTEIRKLVEDGIIDASFTVRDSDQCQELVTSGKSGIFFGAWWNMSWPLNNMVEEDPDVRWNAYLAPLTDDGTYNTATLNPSSSFLVVKKGSSEELKEAVIKVMNYQFDIDQDQGVSLKSDPSDPYSWTSMPFSILLSTYNDKESKAEKVLDVAAGKLDQSELTGEAAQWCDSYLQCESDIKTAIAGNNLAGWAYTRGCQPLVEGADIMNKVFDATYLETETMNDKWATLEKLEDEFYLQVLNGDATADDFDSYVSQWNDLGGAEIIQELTDLMSENN